MEQSLTEAARQGNIDALYASLRQNPHLFKKIDETPFVDTPLHTAASAGSTHFAIEILGLKPSYGNKLNPDGFSPLDLALLGGQTQTVKGLIKHDPRLIRVKGKERFTPLHFVAELEDEADLLAEFLFRCPESMEDLTIRGESAVHIAVRNSNLRGLKVLLGWMEETQNRRILGWEDENGNTVLHIAACTNNFETVRLLIKNMARQVINGRNADGLTALDIALGLPNAEKNGRIAKALRSAGANLCNFCHVPPALDDFISSSHPRSANLADSYVMISEESLIRKLFRILLFGRVKFPNPITTINSLSADSRNALLVVAVLLTTATYQAILSPPGGFSGSDISNGPNLNNTTTDFLTMKNWKQQISTVKLQMNPSLFYGFLMLNTAPFLASVFVIHSLCGTGSLGALLKVSLVSLVACYSFSALVIAPNPVVGYCFFGVMQIIFCRMYLKTISDMKMLIM